MTTMMTRTRLARYLIMKPTGALDAICELAALDRVVIDLRLQRSPNGLNEYVPAIVSIGTPCAIAVTTALRAAAFVRERPAMMICAAA